MKKFSFKAAPSTELLKVLIYIFLILLTAICLFPFYTMIINSTRTSMEINRGISILPGRHLLTNLANLSKKIDIIRGLVNSLLIALSATAISSYFSALTAYGFAIYRFPGRNILFAVILGFMMVPQQLGLIGLFQLANSLELVDTYALLIIPAAANSFFVFFLRQYIGSTIPPSLIQAARIDGAGEFRIFHTIALPLITPAIATMAIFTFVASWNNYIIPLVLIFTKEKYTVPMLIAQLNSTAYKTDFGLVYLGVAISVIPILVIFSILSRYIISNIAYQGLKE